MEYIDQKKEEKFETTRATLKVLAITAIFIGWQAYLTRSILVQQEHVSHLENRAYLAIEDPRVNFMDGKAQFLYKIKNYGKTPASGMISAIGFVDEEVEGNKFLPPQASYTEFTPYVSYNYEQIRGQELKLFVYYKDYLGKKYKQTVSFFVRYENKQYIFDIIRQDEQEINSDKQREIETISKSEELIQLIKGQK